MGGQARWLSLYVTAWESAAFRIESIVQLTHMLCSLSFTQPPWDCCGRLNAVLALVRRTHCACIIPLSNGHIQTCINAEWKIISGANCGKTDSYLGLQLCVQPPKETPPPSCHQQATKWMSSARNGHLFKSACLWSWETRIEPHFEANEMSHVLTFRGEDPSAKLAPKWR